MWGGQSVYEPGVLGRKLTHCSVPELTCTFLPPKPSPSSAVMASWIEGPVIVEKDPEFSFWSDKWLFCDKLRPAFVLEREGPASKQSDLKFERASLIDRCASRNVSPPP